MSSIFLNIFLQLPAYRLDLSVLMDYNQAYAQNFYFGHYRFVLNPLYLRHLFGNLKCSVQKGQGPGKQGHDESSPWAA
jgi:hypothetical protein